MSEPTKLVVNFWGLTINAEGLWAVVAAVCIVSLAVIALRFKR